MIFRPRCGCSSGSNALDAFDALLAAVAIREGATLLSAERVLASVPRLKFVELGSPAFDKLLA